MSADENEQYDELCAWTLSRREGGFVHQFVVDCWALQHATADTKPMGLAFPLVSLCLHLEHGQTGRQAQLAHMQLAKLHRGPRKNDWPRLPLPKQNIDFNVSEILNLESDSARDAALHRWCELTWEAWSDSHVAIRELLKRELQIGA